MAIVMGIVRGIVMVFLGGGDPPQCPPAHQRVSQTGSFKCQGTAPTGISKLEISVITTFFRSSVCVFLLSEPAARSGRPVAPLPADYPAEAGERPSPEQKGWTITNERNGAKIKVVCEVFFEERDFRLVAPEWGRPEGMGGC